MYPWNNDLGSHFHFGLVIIFIVDIYRPAKKDNYGVR